MTEQPPEAWIGQEVTVYYGYHVAQTGIGGSNRVTGTLKSVSDRGVVVTGLRGDVEQTAFYPFSSIDRLLYGSPPAPKARTMRTF